jgi:hypothetical protein
MNNRNATAANSIARLILFVVMVGVGIAATLTLTKNIRWGAYVCAGTIGLMVVVWLIGGYIVAASKTSATEE